MSSPLAALSKTTPAWVEMCGQLAPLAAIIVFMAPMPTIRQVSKDRTVGSLPLLPYSSMVANAFVWVVYGVLKKEPQIYTPNIVGLILGMYYFWVFTRHCPKVASTLPGSVNQHMYGCAAIIFASMAIAMFLPTPSAASIIGTMGVTICVVLFASPLAALKTVVETKSAKSIPLPFTVAAVTNCGLWSVVGVLQMHDVNIYLPNLLGLAFGIAQVILKLYYGNGTATEVKLPF